MRVASSASAPVSGSVIPTLIVFCCALRPVAPMTLARPRMPAAPNARHVCLLICMGSPPWVGHGVGKGAQAEAKTDSAALTTSHVFCERVGRGALQGQQDSAAAALSVRGKASLRATPA